MKTEEVALVLQGITLGLKNFSSEPILDNDEELDDEDSDWSIIASELVTTTVDTIYTNTGSLSEQTGNISKNGTFDEKTEKLQGVENDIEMVKIEQTDDPKADSEIETWTVSANDNAKSEKIDNPTENIEISPISTNFTAPLGDHAANFCREMNSEPPGFSTTPENPFSSHKSPFQKPKPKPIPILYKQKYAAIFVQKGRTKESKLEIEEMYKKDFPEIFPNTKYEKMSR